MSVDLTIRSLTRTAAAPEAQLASRAGRTQKTPDAAEKFEAFVLQTFIQEMLPKDTESVFGQGISGDFWKSMLSEKIAENVAERGDLGIADFVRASRSADPNRSAAPIVPADATSGVSALGQALAIPLPSVSDGD